MGQLASPRSEIFSIPILATAEPNLWILIPPDTKDIDRITDLINPKDLTKNRSKEEETTKEEEKAKHSPRAKAHLQKEIQGQYILLQPMLIHWAVEVHHQLS